MIVVLISLMLFVFIPPSSSAEQPSRSPAQIVEGVVAIVTIKAREPIRELIFYSDLERYRLFFAPREAQSNPAQRLNQVIHQRLLRPEAKRFVLQDPRPDAIKGRLIKIQKRFENDMAFEAALHQTGLFKAELEDEIREYLWVEQLLNERITDFIFINPKSIENYFEAHPDLFKGRTLEEMARQIESFLSKKKELAKKEEYLRRIREKAEIKILWVSP